MYVQFSTDISRFLRAKENKFWPLSLKDSGLLYIVECWILLGMKSPYNRSPGLSGLGPSMSTSLLLHQPLNYLSFRAILRFDGNPSLPNHGSRPLILSAFPPRACSSIHHRASHRGLFWSKRNHFVRQFLRYAWRPPAVGFVGDQFCSGNHNFSVTARCVRD